MKSPDNQLSYLLNDPRARRNLKGLVRYLLIVGSTIAVFTLGFHLIARYEGVEYSWVTGLYWTLTVMSTLGFGDITFQSDVGRVFSIVVLLTGIFMLLIVLPFAFIRFFYAPWLEAQLRSRAPRQVPVGTAGHVLLCPWTPLTRVLVERLRQMSIPHYVVEPDPTKAAELHGEHIPVIRGELDERDTYHAASIHSARAVVTCASDAANTNITLTIREASSDVQVITTVEYPESVDVLELAGASHVLPLKQRLGEQLANRVNARRCEAHVVGRFKNLLIAEFTLNHTPFAGKSLLESRLRQRYGINVVGIWHSGQLTPPRPDLKLEEACVLVVVGTQAGIDSLNRELAQYDVNQNPVIVIGGGRVGQAATRALKRRGVTVHLVEHDRAVAAQSRHLVDKVLVGEGAELSVLKEAGIDTAPSVMLTTNDDATNIYLSIYCRRLNNNIRIVSRITSERNVQAIHRAGADFVLSYASLARESIIALIQHQEMIFLGEGIGFFTSEVPASLEGKTLGESGIGARSGVNVVALRMPDQEIVLAQPAVRLESGSELLTIGTEAQYQHFLAEFGRASRRRT